MRPHHAGARQRIVVGPRRAGVQPARRVPARWHPQLANRGGQEGDSSNSVEPGLSLPAGGIDRLPAGQAREAAGCTGAAALDSCKFLQGDC